MFFFYPNERFSNKPYILQMNKTLIIYFKLLVSRIILESGLCSLPSNNSLWDSVRLPPSDSDDSETCFHGKEFGNCNRNNPIRDSGCKWWHFHSIERKSELDRKFKEIFFDRPPPTKAQRFVTDLGIEVQKFLGLRS